MPHVDLLSIVSRFTATRVRRAGSMLLAAASVVAAGSACGGNDDDYPALRPVDSARMQSTVSEAAAELLVPGAVVLVRTPKGDFSYSYGTTTYKGSTPTSPDLHIRVGSVTKTWTATVILLQAQDKLLKLSDTIDKYVDGVPKGNEITIEQLLTMRSGLFNYSTTLEFNQALDDDPHRVWTQSDVLAMAFQHDQDFDPGTSYTYSNTNTILLGLVAEKVEGGKPLAAIMQDRIFKPLGMANTLLPATTVDTLPAPFSHGYQYGTNVQTLEKLPPELQAAARAGTFLPTDETDDNPSWGWSAGAGISTTDDLVTFVHALVGGGLLNADMQAARIASVRAIVPPVRELGYGWGLARFGALYGHTGELPGYNTFMGYDPVNKVTLVVWTNLEPTMDKGAAATALARTLIQQIYVTP